MTFCHSRLQLNANWLFDYLLCLCLQCRSGSLQRSRKVLLQRKCISWSRYVTPTLSFTLLTKAWIQWDACHSDLLVWEGLLYQSFQAGIAEALLTCVFQGSVIWNSQMSPWQTNGNAGVMEVGIHALCRLSLCVHQGCWGLWCNSVAVFGPQDLLQHRGAAWAPAPNPDSSHQALHDGPQTTPEV